MSANAPQVRSASDEALDPCLVCGGVQHTTLYPSTFKGTVEAAADYFLAHRTATTRGRIVSCRQCGFVFTSPRFSNADYDRIYRAIPVAEHPDPAFEAANAARFRRLGRIVRGFCLEGGDFMDFGCGDGGFLRAFGRGAGRGFEVGPPGRRTAGSCEVITGEWAAVAGSVTIPPKSLDYVVAFDVLEHLPRIKQDISLIHTVLKPRGLFFATVPNIASLIARAMGPRWSMLLLEHLWYFSPATFERMMGDLGFELLDVRQVPFDAPVAHIATRLAQTFGMKGAFRAGPMSSAVLPMPAGIMLGVFGRMP